MRIFASFDLGNDEDLHDALLAQSSRLNAGFEISARSQPETPSDPRVEAVRRGIREADEVIVICGRHTDDSLCVSAELRIAQEEEKPYFLLWGRRESMCTRPEAAKPGDAMYSWTWEILQSQIVAANRKGQAERTAKVLAGFANPTAPKPAPNPPRNRSPNR